MLDPTDREDKAKRVRVLFVCMGNICRSPTAEAVFKQLAQCSGLGDRIHSDSAGTHDYHIGEPPDDRAQQAARRRGYDLSALRARQIRREDFTEFDYVLAMDGHNLQLLARSCPAEHRGKLTLLMQFSAEQPGRDVPDPYYGGPQGFEQVLDMLEDAAQGLLRRIRESLG
ncbi:MAG: low molecular weight phosphotyrosine protein phosphatase [Betaproteobacteria bacterium]|nr:low molecular weight phosphotyrosine protein phosphatase [Betaproteobacteria bacterium]